MQLGAKTKGRLTAAMGMAWLTFISDCANLSKGGFDEWELLPMAALAESIGPIQVQNLPPPTANPDESEGFGSRKWASNCRNKVQMRDMAGQKHSVFGNSHKRDG